MQNGVQLKKGKEKVFHNRHQWLFSGAIERFPGNMENGRLYPIYGDSEALLGHGYFHRGISLAGRIVSFGDVEPLQAIRASIEQARALRRAYFDERVTNAYRLINGEGDFLPGLVVDQYGDTLVLQSNTLGMDLLKPVIVEALSPYAIYEKSTAPTRREEGLKEVAQMLQGESRDEGQILENGLTFTVSWKTGQKTGFFLDQREMRKRIGELSRGKRVLNCFAYTGGFTVYCQQGGAAVVDSLDISKGALAIAEQNSRANGFTTGRFIEEDAFTFLRNDPLQYDLIILDPPAFAKKKDDVKGAIKGYRDINFQAFSKMPRDTLLLTCSCSYHVDDTLFRQIIFQAARQANRSVQILETQRHGIDHPVSLYHPESHYLKGLLLRVL